MAHKCQTIIKHAITHSQCACWFLPSHIVTMRKQFSSDLNTNWCSHTQDKNKQSMWLCLFTSVMSYSCASSENSFVYFLWMLFIMWQIQKFYTLKFNLYYFLSYTLKSRLGSLFSWKGPCSKYVRVLKSHSLSQQGHSAIVLDKQP